MEFEYGPGDEAVVEVSGDDLRIRFGSWELETKVSSGYSLDQSRQGLSISTDGVSVQRELTAYGHSATPMRDSEWHYLGPRQSLS